MNHGNDHTTIWGTLSGTALGIAATISSFDIAVILQRPLFIFPSK
jgi:hypothetical protein